MTSAARNVTTDAQPHRFVPPLGWPPKPRAQICRAADRPPLIGLNRYVRQVIGIGIRLPNDDKPGHPYLSLVWAKPARWWKR